MKHRPILEKNDLLPLCVKVKNRVWLILLSFSLELHPSSCTSTASEAPRSKQSWYSAPRSVDGFNHPHWHKSLFVLALHMKAAHFPYALIAPFPAFDSGKQSLGTPLCWSVSPSEAQIAQLFYRNNRRTDIQGRLSYFDSQGYKSAKTSLILWNSLNWEGRDWVRKQFYFRSSCQKLADVEKLKAALSTRVTLCVNLTNFKHKGAEIPSFHLELDI